MSDETIDDSLGSALINSLEILLKRHKTSIIDDVLLNEAVIKLLYNENLFSESDFAYLIYDENEEISVKNNEKKFNHLLNILVKDENFEKFCSLVKDDCTALITAMINDLNGNTPKTKDDDDESSITDRDTIDSSRSRRSSSYSTHYYGLQPNNHAPNEHSVNNNNINNSNNDSEQEYSTLRKLPLLPTSLEKKRYSSPPYYGYEKPYKKYGNKDNRNVRSMNETVEVLADQVIEEVSGDRTAWDVSSVVLYRVPGYGFGIAVSGGRDNPHFANGDPSIAVSDVLKGGPAEDRLQVNDRIISANGVSLENVEYATAVQVLRDSGNTVTLVVKRRIPQPGVGGGGAMVSNINGNSYNQSSMINHQHSHSLSSTGLIGNGSQQQIKVLLTKSSKKEDFGIVLGCRLFVKEISSKTRDQLQANGYSLQEGDIVTRIHNTNCGDLMSIKEAKKIIDGCKERLSLAVIRDPNALGGLPPSNTSNNLYSHQQQLSNCSNVDSSYSTQNLYVQPPTRPSLSTLLDDKCNLTPRGRSRGPLTDISLSQLDLPSTPQTAPQHSHSRSTVEEPVRPPPPRNDDYYSTRPPLTAETTEQRFISFQKLGSVGIRLTGGNQVGIFVTAVQQNSQAALQGLVPGDKIIKVNDMDMNGVTREEAVLFLLSLQDRIDLIVQYCKEEYDNVMQSQRGDSFHIKTHFHYDSPSKSELSFRAGDVFRVVDTLHNGVVGSWQVLRIGRGHQELQRGIIPNKARAEELATAQFNASKKEMNTSESRVSFFRRKRTTHRRSKSLSRENWDDVVFSDAISKFPAYERVVLRHPGFVRPVVMFGPVADLAREKLIKDFPDKFTAPLQDDDKSQSKCGIVRLSNIRDIVDRAKHALLDITPNAVDRLNYAQFYPIVIFLKTDTKHTIKQLRHGIPKSAHKSSKKLLEQCLKLDRIWSHVFSASINLNDTDSWYRKLRETIDQQQSGAVWMSETKPVESLSDDFLFPMTTSRLSYASSPESDLEMSPGPSSSLSLGNLPQLVKSNSDPSIATNQDNLDRDRDIEMAGMPPPYMGPYDQSSSHNRRSGAEFKYGFSQNTPTKPEDPGNLYVAGRQGNQSLYGQVPELPPRIDRASKPTMSSSTPASSLPSRNSSILQSGGTLGRTSQDRFFGNLSKEQDDLYTTSNKLMGTIDTKKMNGNSSNANSLERHDMIINPHNTQHQTSLDRSNPIAKNGSSYDSVSSYDSYNTTQIQQQVNSNRLGPNAPDDLKSVPNAVGRPQLDPTQDINTRDYSFDSDKTNAMNLPQRPSNLLVDSPRKQQLMESKTDYGKYSRNNSASQTDYTKTNKSTPMVPPPNAAGMPFKPIPPPKPKNYRPPMQGTNGGQWDNGDSTTPRSPNGFYYPSSPQTQTHSHYHHQSMSMSMQAPPSNMYQQSNGPYGHTQYSSSGPNYGQNVPLLSAQPQMFGNHYGAGNYMHRNHGFGNLPPTPSDRYSLDLAGSREQRGSAFELYRKPVGTVPGGHHNMRMMESPSFNQPYPMQQAPMHPQQQQHRYDLVCDSPPALPVKPKKNLLKSPLKAIKNAITKSTKTLRRQASFMDPSEKKKSNLRRQHSMMEPRSKNVYYPPLDYSEYQQQQQQYYNFHYHQQQQRQRAYPEDPYDPRGDYYRHERFYPNETYSREPVYGGSMYEQSSRDAMDGMDESIYANRALIELERHRISISNTRTGGRLVRRHSMKERGGIVQQLPEGYSTLTKKYDIAVPVRQLQQVDVEPIYQSKSGSYMYDEQRQRRPHVDPSLHEIKSSYEMRSIDDNEKLLQARKELVQSPSTSCSTSSTSSPSKERNLKNSRRQLKEQIYQSRLETMQSMAEPIYVSRNGGNGSLRSQPIYESKKESEDHDESKSNNNSKEKTELNSSKESDGNPNEKSLLEAIEETMKLNQSQEMMERLEITDAPLAEQEIPFADEGEHQNSQEKTLTPNMSGHEDSEFQRTSSKRSQKSYHISNIIKRTAPPPPPVRNFDTQITPDVDKQPICASQTSIETQYTSQASLPIGPPNAQSTPYTSELTLQQQKQNARDKFFASKVPTIRESITTRGVFDEHGGVLEDKVWNVKLIIPENALPKGRKQEIYFTVTDPRLSEEVGGPPLDMENGERVLSPLIKCSPVGLNFLVPVTLVFQHSAHTKPSLGLALKATDSEKSPQTDWDNIDLPSNTATTVSVKVDHF